MIARCISNRIDIFRAQEALYQSLVNMYGPSGEAVHLTPSLDYVVYAVSFHGSRPHFFVADDCYCTYPVSYEASFFEIIDSRCSRFWNLPVDLSRWPQLECSRPTEIVSIAPWAQAGQRFYEYLVDGAEKELKIFTQYKELMDLEFRPPGHVEFAVVLQGPWVQCPFCSDAWEDGREDEMLRCPTCGKLLSRSYLP